MKKILLIIFCGLSFFSLKAQETLQIPERISASKADKFSNKRTYQHSVFKRDPRPFMLYLYGCDTARLLFVKCQYIGRNWIFFDKVLFLNDKGEKFELKFSRKDLDRKVASGGIVYETGTRDLSYSEIQNLKSFLTNALKIDVRFIGDYQYDSVFKERKIKAGLELIDFFYIDNKAVAILKEIYDLEQKIKEK